MVLNTMRVLLPASAATRSPCRVQMRHSVAVAILTNVFVAGVACQTADNNSEEQRDAKSANKVRMIST